LLGSVTIECILGSVEYSSPAVLQNGSCLVASQKVARQCGIK